MKKLLGILIVLAILLGIVALRNKTIPVRSDRTDQPNLQQEEETRGREPLSIEGLRKGVYPGSPLVIQESLPQGSNYKQQIVSYQSEGLKIYALLTVPNGEQPKDGWPVIVFNHGYIPPTQYRTIERYIAYVDSFARNGYIVLKPDYRGHGTSEGEPTGAYGSDAYTIDVLNAVASIKQYPTVNPSRIGMWGHSMGGHITLRSMVTRNDIRAGVIWAGVVASYPDLLYNWRRGTPTPSPLPTGARRWRQMLIERYGSPEQNPKFWNSISATSYLADISGPVQLHHGTADTSVPLEFSETLKGQLEKAGKVVELYTYPGDDHNIASSFGTAIERSIEFFNKHL